MCRLYEWLFVLIPVRTIRERLLRSHIEECGRCRERLEPEADLGAVAALPDWIQAENKLWPAIRERIELRPQAPAPRQPRPWAIPAAVAGLILLAAFGLRVFGPADGRQGSSQVTIVRAESYGRRASTYIYQTGVAAYVWITGMEKTDEE